VLLRDAGQKSRNILERHDRDVEGIAEANEARGLERCVDVEDTGEYRRLIRDDADAETAEVGESADDVAGVLALHFIELGVIDDTLDDFVHVVGLVRIVGYDI
jgi:hypothetical protein